MHKRPFRISHAAHCLHQGAVIAYPTEAVWGLGCDPFNELAVARLLALKQRSEGKGLILIAASIEQFAPYLSSLSARQKQTLQDSWPAPITWLVPDNGFAPSWIRGRFNSVALRVTAHPIAKSLCEAFGAPIVSSSANTQGRVPAKSPLRVQHYFPSSLATVVPGHLGKNPKPTQIKDLVSGAKIR